MIIKANVILPKDLPHQSVRRIFRQAITDFLYEQERQGWLLRRKPSYWYKEPHPTDPCAEIWCVAADMARAPVRQVFDVSDAVAKILLKDPKWKLA